MSDGEGVNRVATADPATTSGPVPEARPSRHTTTDGLERSRARRERSGATLASRVSWTIAGITIAMWGLQLSGYVDAYPAVSALMVVLGIWGLGTVLAAWYPRQLDPRLSAALVFITVVLALAGFIVWSILQITTSPGYGTDEVAFDQYAAQLLIHGMNPYTHSMAPAFALFHVSPNGYTFLLDGQPVTSLSYPALSFLPYAPFLLLGWSTQMGVMVNVFAWGLGIVLAFMLLPRSVRPLAIVVGSLGIYTGYAVGGVTDALFVPLLIGAVYRWDDFTTRRGSRPGEVRCCSALPSRSNRRHGSYSHSSRAASASTRPAGAAR